VKKPAAKFEDIRKFVHGKPSSSPATLASTSTAIALPVGGSGDTLDVLRNRLKARKFNNIFDSLPEPVQAEFTEAI
jgi:hypothetical protein